MVGKQQKTRLWRLVQRETSLLFILTCVESVEEPFSGRPARSLSELESPVAARLTCKKFIALAGSSSSLLYRSPILKTREHCLLLQLLQLTDIPLDLRIFHPAPTKRRPELRIRYLGVLVVCRTNNNISIQWQDVIPFYFWLSQCGISYRDSDITNEYLTSFISNNSEKCNHASKSFTDQSILVVNAFIFVPKMLLLRNTIASYRHWPSLCVSIFHCYVFKACQVEIEKWESVVGLVDLLLSPTAFINWHLGQQKSYLCCPEWQHSYMVIKS